MFRSLDSHSATAFLKGLSGVWTTLVLSAVAILVFTAPDVSRAIEYDRLRVVEGEVWRLVTCHLAHWNLEHLFWDVLTFAALGALCELRNRRRFMLCLGLSALVISAVVWLYLPHMGSYRGLSGIDTALFMLLAVTLLQDKWQRRAWPSILAVGLAIIGCGGKIAYEIGTGDLLFVDPHRAQFVPLPWVHVAGALVGLLLAVPKGPGITGERWQGDTVTT